MIGELLFLLLGAGIGIVVGWIATSSSRGSHSNGTGMTVAEIRGRIEREHTGANSYAVPDRPGGMVISARG